jgi:hypothetical protein
MTRRRRDPDEILTWFAVGAALGLAWLLVQLTNSHTAVCQ